MATSEEEKLLAIEQQLSDVERRVFGTMEKEADYPKIVDTLLTLNKQMKHFAAEKTNINAAFDRVGEIEQFLNSQSVDKLTLTHDAKLDLILSEEESIREWAGLLERVEGLTTSLDSEHIKAVPSYQDKLHQLSQIHLHQQDKANELSEETLDLLNRYNHIINLLSKQFVQWDELISQIEMANQKKPVVE